MTNKQSKQTRRKKSGAQRSSDLAHQFVFSGRLLTAIDRQELISLIIYELGDREGTILTGRPWPIWLQASSLAWWLEHVFGKAYAQHTKFHQTDQALRQAQISYLVDHLFNKLRTKDDAATLRSILWKRYKEEKGLLYGQGLHGRERKERKSFDRQLRQVVQAGRWLLVVEFDAGQTRHIIYVQRDQSYAYQTPVYLWSDIIAHRKVDGTFCLELLRLKP